MKARLSVCVGALLSFTLLCLCLSCAGDSGRADKDEIKASVQHLRDALQARNLDAIMEYYVPDESLFVYDAIVPRQFVGAKAYRKNWENFLALFSGPIQAEILDWTVTPDANMAYGFGPFRVSGTDKDGKPLDFVLRVTDVYRKTGGKWLCIHEHVSWPVELSTGKADLMSKS